MNSYAMVKNSVVSNSANISVRVPSNAVGGVSINFLEQSRESSLTENSYALMPYPRFQEVNYAFADSTNQFIWQPGMQAGVPDQLFGHDFITDGFIDAPTSGKKALGFCHAPSFFVRFAGGVNVESSTDYAFANDLVTLRFLMRMDCNGIDDNGLGRLTQA